MKWILRCVFIVIFLSSYPLTIFANKTRMISGLEAASHYHGKANGNIYIRTGSFAHESNAKAYEKLIRSRISAPVKMSFTHGYYVVTIGPLANATEVRQVAHNITQEKQRAKQTKSVQQIKPVKQTKAVKLQPVSKHEPVKVVAPAVVSMTEPTSGPVITTKFPEPSPPPQPEKSTFKSATESLLNSFNQMLPGKKAEPAKIEPVKTQTPVTPVAPVKSSVVDKQQLQPVVVTQPEVAPKKSQPKPLPPKDVEPRLALVTLPNVDVPAPQFMNEFSRANWIVTVGGGEQFPSFNNDMTVNNNSGFPAPFDVDVYSTAKQNQSLFSAFAGRRWVRDNQWFPALTVGANYQYIVGNNVGNTIMQYSDPEFLNYDYSWNVSSNVLLAMLKVNVFEYSRVSPYIAVGLGGAYNHTNDYKENARVNVNPRISPSFSENSSLQFAYALKAGIDWEIAHQVIAAIEYQYMDLGSMTSGHGDGPWSSSSLNLGSYRSNAVLLNVGYYFGS